MNIEETPLVSISCITYNHESYIRQCLDGFMMQKTNFAFEILIHDDASTDKTADIIREYETKYPEIIKPIYQTVNQYSKGIKISITFNFPRAKGKYIALCEGDDYWTDPHKLQRQVDFLEANSDFGLVHTNFVAYNQKEDTYREITFKRDTGNVFDKFLETNQVGALTVLFRKEILAPVYQEEFIKKRFLMGDYPMWLYIARFYKIGYIDEETAVYRVLPESMSNTQNKIKAAYFKSSVLEIRAYFAKQYGNINLILDDLLNQYKHQLKFGFDHKQKTMVIESYYFLKTYNTCSNNCFLYYIGAKYNLYTLSKFILKLKKKIR